MADSRDSSVDRSAHNMPVTAWWVPLIAGGLNLIAALIVLIEPHGSLKAVAIVLGIYLLFAGILLLVSANSVGSHRGLVILLGVLAVIAGIFVILRPGSAIHGVRVVFGIYLLVSGAAHLAAATREESGRTAELVRGGLSIIAGLVFLFAPGLGLAALALFVGIYLLIRAGVDFTIAWYLYHAATRQPPQAGASP